MTERTTIYINMEQALAEELEQQAGSLQMPVDNYIRLVLKERLEDYGQADE